MERIENVATLLDKNTLVCERHFSVTPDTLWNAIATKEGLSHWFMPTKFEIEEGGRFSFGGGWDGTITEVHPPHHIQFTPDDSEDAYLRFEIVETNDGCLFRLIDKMGANQDTSKIFPDEAKHKTYQPGGPGTHWSGIITGYHGFVDKLEGFITGTKIEFDYDDMCKKYMALQDKWDL
jgi:uncharacterized protein YndB with AHSA1/START domain